MDLSKIKIKNENVDLINESIIPQLAEIVPAGKKALGLYVGKDVNKGAVAGIVYGLYVDLFSADMAGIVVESLDSVLKEIEDEQKALSINKRKMLADLGSALNIKWAHRSYRPPSEWKSLVEIMSELKWIKKLEDGGFGPQVAWEHVYLFVKGNFFDDDCFEKIKAKKGLWDKLKGEVEAFNKKIGDLKDEDFADRPKGYGDLEKCLKKLYADMQVSRINFEGYLKKGGRFAQYSEKIGEQLINAGNVDNEIAALKARVEKLEHPRKKNK